MTRTTLTRRTISRASHLLGLAPQPVPLPTKCERIDGATTGKVTPDVDAHLVAVGERARAATR